uniref:Peptidyl-prolyl cis-trans isomerase n=1 Tax=Lumbricus rubellus TaxID=35632 RepID=Q94611_LUMRU|nr:cypB [Lumbricus rubellus]
MKVACGFGVLLVICLQSCLVSAACENETNYDPVVTHKAFFDISIGSKPIGRIVFGLFADLCPYTVRNFASLVLGNTTNSDWHITCDKSSIFHRTINNFMIQGGDFTSQNGYGGLSIYGKYFNDENFKLCHHGFGWLGMANCGPNTNGAQYYISTVDTPWLDGLHNIFGIVLEGAFVVRAIEKNPTSKGENIKDRPILAVVITDCGMLELEKPFTVPKTPVKEC